MVEEKILILDFGGQYTQLIAKAVRKCNVFSEIRPHDVTASYVRQYAPKGIILSGGPPGVYEENAPMMDKEILELGIPVLGICYGMQLINHLLGGKVREGHLGIKEYGETELDIVTDNMLFEGLDKKQFVWMSHGDSVDEKFLAPGFYVTAKTRYHVAGFANDEKKMYGVQFHPEVTHTVNGSKVIGNFVHGICACKSDWTMGNYIEESKEYVRKTAGKNDVICFVSGGVDSSFVAVLLSQTEGIGNIYPVYIEALMRKGETDFVAKSLKKAGVTNLKVIHAEDRFIKSVSGMTEPEEKRKAIGNLFGEIQKEVIEELNLDKDNTFLAQGTLYTDLIESGKGVGKIADTIKSHHNVGCTFIEDLKKRGRIVEPNRLIFKDEVREAARAIGLPPEIAERQPFPGPGLAIRIVSPVTVDDRFYKIHEDVNRIAKEEGMKGHILPIKTVGVQGDGRTYSYLVMIQGEMDWNRIRTLAKRIPKEVHEVNRVVYLIGEADCSQKTVDTTVSRETIDQLKDVDHTVREIIDTYDFPEKITQTIVVLFGADVSGEGKRSVALRAVSTDDFMTVTPVAPDGKKMSWKCLLEIRDVLLQKYDVGAFVIDVTDKPPATTCWE